MGSHAELCITALATASQWAQERDSAREFPWRNGALEQFIANKMPSSLLVSFSHHVTSLCMCFLICKMGDSISTYPRGSV